MQHIELVTDATVMVAKVSMNLSRLMQTLLTAEADTRIHVYIFAFAFVG